VESLTTLNQAPLPHGEEPAQRASRTIWHDRGFHPSRRRYAAPQDEVRHGYGSAISRHELPELWPWFSPKRGSRECRMHAAPAVSRAMGRRKRTRAYRFSGGTPAFPAQWLYGLYVLFPATNSSCHRRRRIEICLSPVGPTRLRRLDISHGCQNHTTSPYAAPSPATPIDEMPTELKGEGLETPVVCADVRSLTGEPRPATTIAPDAAASTASNPASVTIAIRPSCRGGRPE
jgi:hypothetical protein